MIMQAMPDDVIKSITASCVLKAGRYARNVDLDAEPMKTIVATMPAKKSIPIPQWWCSKASMCRRMVICLGYAPFVGTLPPATERGFSQGGFAVPKDLTRADYRASWAKMGSASDRMYQGWRSNRFGTDSSGIEIIRELEFTTRQV